MSNETALNHDDVISMTQIMAKNGDVPANVGGWAVSEGYAGSVQRHNGILGEVVRDGESVYVCVRECQDLALPNAHPQYRPSPGTAWARVPRAADIDWRYVPAKYHR